MIDYLKTMTAALLASVAVCFFSPPAQAQSGALDAARSDGAKYLSSRIAPSGSCLDEPRNVASPEYGLRTAMTVCTLLSLDARPYDAPDLRRAIKWTMDFNPNATAPLAMKILAMCKLNRKDSLAVAEKDVKKLAAFAYADGGFGPMCANGAPRQGGDDCNNQSTAIATQAFYAARERNIPVPVETWKKLNAYWLAQQLPSGGFSWTKYRGATKQPANPYGSMTASGVVCAYMSYSALRIADLAAADKLATVNDRVVTDGVAWIAKHLDFNFNPNKGAEWYYQWLEQLSLMCRMTGYRQLNGWWLQDRINLALFGCQNADGSWGDADRILQTCRALNAIAQGGSLVFINKIRFTGMWNTHFDDIANAISWLEKTYELPMDWQVVDLDQAGLWDCTGRVCYLSGAGRVDFNAHHAEVLRDFIDRGGILISESADGDGEFSLSIQRLYQKLFPAIRKHTLPADTPLLNQKFKLTQPSPMFGLSNGVRLLAVHIPQGISRQLEQNLVLNDKSTYEFFANLLFYLYPNPARDYKRMKSSFAHSPVAVNDFTTIARVQYKGNFDPEPYAMQYFADCVTPETRSGARLCYKFVTFEDLDASKYKVAVLSGTGEFPPLGEKEMLKVQQYLVDGGTIIADAAGSDKTFISSFTRNFMQKLGKPLPMTAPQKPAKLSASHELNTIYIEGRPAVMFSPVDIQAGLVGYSLSGLESWGNQSNNIMLNLLRTAGIDVTKMSSKNEK